MGALYAVHYDGEPGKAEGAVYLGKHLIVGVDVANARYHGAYTEIDGRVIGAIAMTSPLGGISLSTGEPFPLGKVLPIQIDWPTDFADGQARELRLGGHAVRVTLDKVGDIP